MQVCELFIGIIMVLWLLGGGERIKNVRTQLSVTVSTLNIHCHWIWLCGVHCGRTGIKWQFSTILKPK